MSTVFFKLAEIPAQADGRVEKVEKIMSAASARTHCAYGQLSDA
jgi:hypothetical protein